MREADFELYMENFRAIADERMADITVTPEFKERVLAAAANAPAKGKVVPFGAKRAAIGTIAVAAALLIAAIGAPKLFGGGAQSPMEATLESAPTEDGCTPRDSAEDYALPEGDGMYTMELPPEPQPAPGMFAGAGEDAQKSADDSPKADGDKEKGGDANADPGRSANDEIAGNDESLPQEEALLDEADDMGIAALDPEADTAPGLYSGGAILAPIEEVTVVFTGQVVSSQFVTLSLLDGSVILAADAPVPSQNPDQPLPEDAPPPPVYGYVEGERLNVAVTSYLVEGVHYGEAVSGSVVRVLGASGLVGTSEVVAASGVANSNGSAEIRYDLLADYAAVLIESDTSAENIARITGMVNAG